MDRRPPDWTLVRALFDAVADLPSSERDARLADAARDGAFGDETVAEVRSLLAHADDVDAFLSAPAARPRAVPADRAGEVLGPWRLTALLGSGGMGDVWHAERDDGAWAGEAAVKVLKRGMDTEAVLARFAQEQQALARLNHPHIARLLDAGRTPDGLPYFVMERVHGRPIDAACEGLPTAARLGLFLQLADAVAYAHRQLLVHRDLKPANVLVDDEGRVRLLDFGIAKAIDAGPGDSAPTALGERPLTPQYASPEQLRGEPVGTATDVYSLGVLLYVMLTGHRPHGEGDEGGIALAQAVLDEPPRRPSSWLPALRGDLDNILLRALQKDPERRYAGVDAFAADVRAHLEGRPVAARRPSRAYVVGRFVRRNRLASALAVLGIAGLAAGLGLTQWQLRETAQANQRAEARLAQVRQLAHGLVFRYHDQIVNLPGSIPVREALLSEASRYLDAMVADGEADPALAREVAETYLRIAVLQGESFSPSQERLADAARNVDRAIALLPRYVDRDDVDAAALNAAADMWMTRANLRARGGALPGALDALQAAHGLVARARALAPDDLQAWSRQATLEGRIGLLLGGSASTANLGRVAAAVKQLGAAERQMATLSAREPANAEWTHQHAWACQLLSRALLLDGRKAEAGRWAREALRLRETAAAAHPDSVHHLHQTATARMAVALADAYDGRPDEALALHDEALAIVRRVHASDPGNRSAERDLGFMDLARGELLAIAGRHAEAAPALRRMLAKTPDDGADFYVARLRAQARIWLARGALAGGDAAQARDEAGAAAQAMHPDAADPNAARWWTWAQALSAQAEAEAALGRGPQAAALAGEALRAWRHAGEPPALFAPWVERDRALAGRGAASG